jgi:hypothetical protein
MTVLGTGTSGGPDLRGCPAAEHVGWVVQHARPGAGRVDGAELLCHVAVRPDLADAAADYLQRWTQGGQAVDELLGWRQTTNGRVAVDYVAADGRACELSWRILDDGRLDDQIHQRSDAEASITGVRTDELSSDTRAQVHAVFAAAYDDADPDYLEAQLTGLQGIGLATASSGEVIGFTLYGWRALDLPVIGVQGVGLPGLACVHPAARGRGVAAACGAAAGPVAVTGPLHVTVSKLATPASLRMVQRAIPVGSWPTAEDPFALYRRPTSTQLAVTAALAHAHGCSATAGAVGIGSGRPIGRPKVEPDVSAEEASLFDVVDRGRGDVLLWIAWLTPPPEAWFR